MNWLATLKQVHDGWRPELFRRNMADYPLTVSVFMALSKGIVEDYSGAAIQLRRAMEHINSRECVDEEGKKLTLALVNDFKKHYPEEFAQVYL
jgi:hypothetical protein